MCHRRLDDGRRLRWRFDLEDVLMMAIPEKTVLGPRDSSVHEGLAEQQKARDGGGRIRRKPSTRNATLSGQTHLQRIIVTPVRLPSLGRHCSSDLPNLRLVPGQLAARQRSELSRVGPEPRQTAQEGEAAERKLEDRRESVRRRVLAGVESGIGRRTGRGPKGRQTAREVGGHGGGTRNATKVERGTMNRATRSRTPLRRKDNRQMFEEGWLGEVGW